MLQVQYRKEPDGNALYRRGTTYYLDQEQHEELLDDHVRQDTFEKALGNRNRKRRTEEHMPNRAFKAQELRQLLGKHDHRPYRI